MLLQGNRKQNLLPSVSHITITYTTNGHFASTKALVDVVVALVAFALLPLPFLDGEGYMDMALLWTLESDPLASIQASFGFDFASNPVSQKKKKKN